MSCVFLPTTGWQAWESHIPWEEESSWWAEGLLVHRKSLEDEEEIDDSMKDGHNLLYYTVEYLANSPLYLATAFLVYQSLTINIK